MPPPSDSGVPESSPRAGSCRLWSLAYSCAATPIWRMLDTVLMRAEYWLTRVVAGIAMATSRATTVNTTKVSSNVNAAFTGRRTVVLYAARGLLDKQL